MSIAVVRHRPHLVGVTRFLPAAALALTVLVSGIAGVQWARRAGVVPPAPWSPFPITLRTGPDLQGIWDFTMRVGERTSPGFLALGPVEQGWAGSITMYLTNTLAIRTFAVHGDSVRMVVASRDGDVRFVARVSSDGRTMEGIVEYHRGERLPMTAIRRAVPTVPR